MSKPTINTTLFKPVARRSSVSIYPRPDTPAETLSSVENDLRRLIGFTQGLDAEVANIRNQLIQLDNARTQLRDQFASLPASAHAQRAANFQAYQQYLSAPTRNPAEYNPALELQQRDHLVTVQYTDQSLQISQQLAEIEFRGTQLTGDLYGKELEADAYQKRMAEIAQLSEFQRTRPHSAEQLTVCTEPMEGVVRTPRPRSV